MGNKLRDAPRRIEAIQTEGGSWSIKVWIGDLCVGEALTINELYNQSIMRKQKHFNIPDADVKIKHFPGRTGEQLDLDLFLPINHRPVRKMNNNGDKE
jgi:hypothetical protein